MAFPSNPSNGRLHKEGKNIYIWTERDRSWTISPFDKNTIDLINSGILNNIGESTLSLAGGGPYTVVQGADKTIVTDTSSSNSFVIMKGGENTNILRTNNIEDQAPTGAEIGTPVDGDTAIIKLTNGIIEFWSHASGWFKKFSQTPSTLDGNRVNITRIDSIVNIMPTAVEVPNPIDGDTAVVFLTDGKIEYWVNNGVSWALVNTIDPVVLDGNDTHIQRVDTTENVEPTAIEVPSPVVGDTAKVKLANNIVEHWSHNGTIWNLDFTVNYENSDRVFASSADVTVATIGKPTESEVKIWNDGLAIPNSNTIIYYTGTTISTDTITYIFHVDNSGNITLLQWLSIVDGIDDVLALGQKLTNPRIVDTDGNLNFFAVGDLANEGQMNFIGGAQGVKSTTTVEGYNGHGYQIISVSDLDFTVNEPIAPGVFRNITAGVSNITNTIVAVGEIYIKTDTSSTSGVLASPNVFRDGQILYIEAEQKFYKWNGTTLIPFSSGGLAQGGSIPSSILLQGIYTAEGTNTTVSLYPALGSQDRVMVTSTSLGIGTVISVPSGESLNGVVDGTYTTQSDGEVLLFLDNGVGEWTVQVVGASSVSDTYQTQTETLVYGATAVEGVSYSADISESNITGLDLKITRHYIGNGMADVTIVADTVSLSADALITITLPTDYLTTFNYGSIDRDSLNTSAEVITGSQAVDTFFINRDDNITGTNNMNIIIKGQGKWVGPVPSSVVMAGMVAPTPIERDRADITTTSGLSTSWAAVSNIGQLILPEAGTYRLYGAVSTYIDGSASTGALSARLYNVTDSVAITGTLIKVVQGSNSTYNDSATNYLEQEITVTVPTTIELQGIISQSGAATYQIVAESATNAGTWIAYETKPTSTVVNPGDVPVEDVRVLLGDYNGGGGSQTVLDGGLTWNDVIANYESILIIANGNGSSYESTQLDVSEIDPANEFRVWSSDSAGNWKLSIGFDVLTTGDVTFSSASWTTVGVKVYGIKAQKTIINTVDTPINDQTVSGYFDIGNMRMQWGRGATSAGGDLNIILPAAMANPNYSIALTAGGSGNQDYSLMYNSESTTSFQVKTNNSGGNASMSFSWQAVGVKP